MHVTPVKAIEGAFILESEAHRDERGFFVRTFDTALARSIGLGPAFFAQDSASRSRRGVRRGMHLRGGDGESKLVRCSYGAIFDVIVDLRVGSPTYGRKAYLELSDDSPRSLFVPAGCAHGFQALTDPADVFYRIDRPHDPDEDITISVDDPHLAIDWPLPSTYMSERDLAAPTLAQVLAGRRPLGGDARR